MSVVLQCPVCTSSFQVQPQQAGQIVACPSCNQTVSVPESVFENQADSTPQTTSATSAQPKNIFGCPFCEGQFGISPEMFGTNVACPHCQKHVSIEAHEQPQETIQIPKISKTKTKKKKQNDLFPPGYQPGQPKVPIESPVIRKGRKKKKDPVIQVPSNHKTEKSRKATRPAAAQKPTAKPTDQSVVNPKARPTSGATAKPKPADPARKKASLPEPSRTNPSTAKSIPPPQTSKPTLPPPSSPARKPPTNPVPVAPVPASSSATETTLPSIEHRLPPKFTAVDPGELLHSSSTRSEEHKVILPDGEGGYKQIDGRVVHVDREGEMVQLFSAPKEQREKKRTIQNLIAIVVGIIILGVAFWLLQGL